MSYSYVKTVFPKFEYSTVYDDKLYKNLNMELIPSEFKPIEASSSLSLPEFSIPKKTEVPVQVQMQGPQVSHLLNYISPFDREASHEAQIKDKKIEMFQQSSPQNNLKVYNQPIVNNNIPNYNNIDFTTATQIIKNEAKNVTEVNQAVSHDLYIKHVMDCDICRERLLKQFNIQTERIRNEEIMELISYIMVGVFILILLDNLKNR